MYILHALIFVLYPTLAVPEFLQFLTLEIMFLCSLQWKASICCIYFKILHCFMYTVEAVALDRLKTGVCFLGSCIYTAGASATGYPWFNAT